MIRSVEVRNLRGIREGTLDDLEPLVILVGPNGSGKSTILDAILIGSGEEAGDKVGQVVRRHRGVRYGARWLSWKTGREGATEIRLTAQTGFFFRSGLTLVNNTPEEAAILNWSPIHWGVDGKPLTSGGGTIVQVNFRNGNVYDTHGRFRLPERAFSVRLVETGSIEDHTPMHRLVSDARTTGLLKEATAIVESVVPGLEEITILTEGDLPLVHLGFETHSIPAALAGDGIHALVRLSLELASRPGGTLLLEEPEIHQHPGSIRQTARAILAAVRRDIQVILTTHSLELIDALQCECLDVDLDRMALYSVVLNDGVLRSSRIPGREVAFLRTTVEQDLR